jgi:hypothetical protein
VTASRDQDGPRTAAALAARRRNTHAALERVHDAITRLRKENAPVTVSAVARRAVVSRTFLYTNDDAKTAIAKASPKQVPSAAGERSDENRDAPWRERALNAEQTLKIANGEIVNQRNQIAELLGRIRDGEARWTQGAVQRITSENTTSSSESSNSPLTTAPSTSACRPPGRTSASRTAESPTSKHNSPHPNGPLRMRLAGPETTSDTLKPFDRRRSSLTCTLRPSAGNTADLPVGGR